MIERRKYARQQMRGYSEVYDNRADELLGRVVNISIMGAMMVSRKPVEVPQSFSCKMNLPEEIDGHDQITFDAESLWCRENTALGCYETGYQIVNISGKDLRLLKRLLHCRMTAESGIMESKDQLQK